MWPNCVIRSTILAPRLAFFLKNFFRFTRLAASCTSGLNAARGDGLAAGPSARRMLTFAAARGAGLGLTTNLLAATLRLTLSERFLQACFVQLSLSRAPRGTFVTYMRVTRVGP